MKLPKFEAKRFGAAYAVFDQSGEKVSGVSSIEYSQKIAEQMGRDAARKVRKCLCCEEQFTSEGAHNRICFPCRGRISDDVGDSSLSSGAF